VDINNKMIKQILLFIGIILVMVLGGVVFYMLSTKEIDMVNVTTTVSEVIVEPTPIIYNESNKTIINVSPSNTTKYNGSIIYFKENTTVEKVNDNIFIPRRRGGGGGSSNSISVSEFPSFTYFICILILGFVLFTIRKKG